MNKELQEAFEKLNAIFKDQKTLENKNDYLRKENEEIEEKFKKATRDLQEYKEFHQNLRKKYEKLEKEHKELEKKHKELEKKIDKSESKYLEKIKILNKELEKKCENPERKYNLIIEELNQEIDKAVLYEDKFFESELEKNIDEKLIILEKMIKEYENENCNKQEEIILHESKFEELKLSLEKLKDQIIDIKIIKVNKEIDNLSEWLDNIDIIKYIYAEDDTYYYESTKLEKIIKKIEELNLSFNNEDANWKFIKNSKKIETLRRYIENLTSYLTTQLT